MTIHHQVVKYSKPHDNEIILTCTGSGISRDKLEYYWWLIHDINSPIYTYSVIAECYNCYTIIITIINVAFVIPTTIVIILVLKQSNTFHLTTTLVYW